VGLSGATPAQFRNQVALCQRLRSLTIDHLKDVMLWRVQDLGGNASALLVAEAAKLAAAEEPLRGSPPA
jgi:hypothetical protein